MVLSQNDFDKILKHNIIANWFFFPNFAFNIIISHIMFSYKKIRISFIRLIALALLTLLPTTISAAEKYDAGILQKLFNYVNTIDTTNHDSIVRYCYHQYIIKTDKRNIILLAVPTLYEVGHVKSRKFSREFYDQITFRGLRDFNFKRLMEVNTIPHRRRALPTFFKFIAPKVYETTLIDNYILSPFNRENKRLYRYKTYHQSDGNVKLTFSPKTGNTQLVKGAALIDGETGRIIQTELRGEHDMIRFRLLLDMGKEGILSLIPNRCQVDGKFTFLGNKLSAKYIVDLRTNNAIADSITEENRLEMMERVRLPLNEEEQEIINQYKERITPKDTVQEAPKKKKENIAKIIFWDYIGEHLLTTLRSDIGSNNQGYIRMEPILNPLYVSYSDRRGFTYKMDARCSYEFSPNCDIYIRAKVGYSFKLKQFYYSIPFELNYNKKHNGYVSAVLGNGNRITNYEVLEDIRREYGDSMKWSMMNMHLFNHTYFKLTNNYDISNKFGFKAGLIYHHRKAVEAKAYQLAGKTDSYKTFAPYLSLQYRPTGWNGPIFTMDYERSIKGFLKSNIAYERWEFDGSYIHPLSRLRSISMRMGYGIYSHLGKTQYFLDFTNFQENHIPGGWKDDWSGEFELLSSEWYNTSRYYFRVNATYESPLMLLSNIPWFGHFIELERFYLSGLKVRNLSSYIEYGYGFTTRWLSLGTFMAHLNGKFDGFGFKFGFELFRRW